MAVKKKAVKKKVAKKKVAKKSTVNTAPRKKTGVPSKLDTRLIRRGWSISELATELGMARGTLSKIARALEPSPHKDQSASPKYYLLDFMPYLANMFYKPPTVDKDFDPDKLPVKDRKEWYAGEKNKIELLQRKGELLEKDDIRQVWAKTLKSIVLSLDTLVDVMERDCGLTIEQSEHMQSILDRKREELYQELACMQKQ